MNRPVALNLAPPPEEGYLQPEQSLKRHQQKYQVDSGFADPVSNGSSRSGSGPHDNGAFAMSPVRDQTHALSLSSTDVSSRPHLGRGVAAHDSYHVDGVPLTHSDDRLHADQQTSFGRTPPGYQNASWSAAVEGGRPQAASPALVRGGDSGSSRTALIAGGLGPKISRENMSLPPRPESTSGGHEYEELPGGGYMPARQNKYLTRSEADGRGDGLPLPDRATPAGSRLQQSATSGHPPNVVRVLSTESGRKKSNPLYSLRLSESSVGRGDSDEAMSSVTELSREQHGDADEVPAKGSKRSRAWQRRWSLLLGFLVIIALIAIGAAIVAVLVAVSAIGGTNRGASPAATGAITGSSTAWPVINPSGNQSFEQRLASLQEQVEQLRNLTAVQAQVLASYASQMSDLDARLQSDAVALRGNYSALSLNVARLDSSVVQFASNVNNSFESLSSLVANVSKMPGPPGPPGFNGSQGAQGTANFSACEFTTDTGQGSTTWAPDRDNVIRRSYYYNMTAAFATCGVQSSTSSGTVTSWQLNRRRDSYGVPQYQCTCTGTSLTCVLYVFYCPNQR